MDKSRGGCGRISLGIPPGSCRFPRLEKWARVGGWSSRSLWNERRSSDADKEVEWVPFKKKSAASSYFAPYDDFQLRHKVSPALSW